MLACSRRADCRLPANKKKKPIKGAFSLVWCLKGGWAVSEGPSRTVLGFPRMPRTSTAKLESLASRQPFPDPGRTQVCQTEVKECWRQAYGCLPPAERMKRKAALGGCVFMFTELVFTIGLKSQTSLIFTGRIQTVKSAFQVTVLVSPGGWCLPPAGSVMSAPEQLYFKWFPPVKSESLKFQL